MKIKSLFLFLLIAGVLWQGAVAAAVQDNEAPSVFSGQTEQPSAKDSAPPSTEKVANSPAAVLVEAAYEFPSVVEGTVIMHAFILRNEGTALLEIKKVRTA